ncbi:hypothetical protein LNV80_21895, partial [Klebsiella pneumoniae]|nr:hypothetical protein [Klebsiella pneumoniae]
KRAYCLKTQPATGETYPKSDLFNKAYQIIKYCIRVFVDRDIKERVTPEIIYKINEIVVKQIALLN